MGLRSLFSSFSRARLLHSFRRRSAAASSEAKILTPDDIIMVPQSAVDSDDPVNIVEENSWVMNQLFFGYAKTHGYIKTNEVSRAARASFDVHYYLSEVENGGFAQFVHNTRWNDDLNDSIRWGLAEMRASRHVALFNEGMAAVKALGEDRLDDFLRSEFFGDNAIRDRLNAVNERFYGLSKSENLIEFNGTWLISHPDLRVFSTDELQKEILRRVCAIPNSAERIAEFKAGQPRYTRLIGALCEQSGHMLHRVTGGDHMLFYDGRTVRPLTEKEFAAMSQHERPIVWFFITDKGVHLMAEANGKAAMFDNETRQKILEIDASVVK